MALPDAKTLIRSSSGAVLIGLVAALLLGSLATAGLNTLTVARLMLLGSLAMALTYLFLSSATASMTRKERTYAVVLLVFGHIALERAEAYYQPLPPKVVLPRFPTPPLVLMMKPPVPGLSHPETQVPGLPLAATYIDRPTGGYAGFGKQGDNENDDVMLGIPGVALRNLSNKPLRLSWKLTFQGEGNEFTLDGTGKGRWERQLNLNDWIALHGGGLRWLLSPTTLPANGRTWATSRLAFVAPNAKGPIRQLIGSGPLEETYKATLTLVDEDTGERASLNLPFGAPPIESNDPVWKELRERMNRDVH